MLLAPSGMPFSIKNPFVVRERFSGKPICRPNLSGARIGGGRGHWVGMPANDLAGLRECSGRSHRGLGRVSPVTRSGHRRASGRHTTTPGPPPEASQSHRRQFLHARTAGAGPSGAARRISRRLARHHTCPSASCGAYLSILVRSPARLYGTM